MKTKDYLGDAVYAHHDGYGITLTTENGVAVTNIIYLEPEILKRLNEFNNMVIEEIRNEQDSNS